MTIAIAIRTGSAVVFAADSKITTSGVVGYEEDGSPRWVEQTYDNATKVVHDRNRTLMAIIAGHANIGQMTATDFISTQQFVGAISIEDQNQKISALVDEMVKQKRAYWSTTQVPEEKWPGPTVLLAAPSPEGIPRVWRLNLEGPGSHVSEILTVPHIVLEGAYDEVFGLLYGYEYNVLMEIAKHLEVEVEAVREATRNLKVLRPIDKLNLWAMPIQDAIEMAVFLANVQVEMDRFLPGTPACGGPIDVMVLRMAPEPGIVAYPGKVLHHPNA
jgi:hypothetical protein